MRRLITDAATRVVRSRRRLVANFTAAGELKYSHGFVVGPGLRVARGRGLRAAENVSVGARVTVMANVSLGRNTLVSSAVSFIGDDHEFQRLDLPIREQPDNPPARITVGEDVLIGYGTIVLGNVRIGDGAVVGAGSLVTKDLPPMTVCVGRPARPIRYRDGSPYLGDGA